MTPVVLVSATAILISGVNTRYISIADRLRSLAHEYRDPSCTDSRRIIIGREITAFQRRMRFVSWAVRALYVAVASFILDALLISATLWREMLAIATLPLFVAGIALLLFALCCQLLELNSSDRTISLELSDIVQDERKR